MSRIALALAVFASFGAALSLLPAPTWSLWLVHLVALETSLAFTLLGLFAFVLARRGAKARERAALLARRLSVVAAIAGLLPFAAAAPLYFKRDVRYSIVEYVRGFPGPAVPVEIDVDLGASGLRADLYRPPGGGTHPLVVVVHGGSWQRGDKGEAPELSRVLASEGFVVADAIPSRAGASLPGGRRRREMPARTFAGTGCGSRHRTRAHRAPRPIGRW